MSTIFDTFDFGYDPGIAEEPRPRIAPQPAALPSSAMVNKTFLPPVGKQTLPNCFVWSSAYGAATFWAAQSSGVSPATPNLQASPDYTYIRVEMANGLNGACVGGQITKVLSFLESNNGTPSLQAAPNNPTCSENWNAYGPQGKTIPPGSPSFAIPSYSSTTITGPDGLNAMRAVIASGVPLVYGTYLYTDFPRYDGAVTPYIGSGIYLVNKNTGKWAGHCMLIIGYNDACQASDSSTIGAVCMQNSFGPDWGSDGYVWMAYPTFQAMAQGLAFSIAS